MDSYGRQLAARLPVRHLELVKERTSSGDFGLPWLHRDALPQLLGDARTVRDLRRAVRQSGGLVHLPHHHTARYGPLLGAPYVLTVHDLIRWYDAHPRAHPEAGAVAPFISVPTSRDRFWLGRDHAAVARAAAIIAVSETTKRDLVRHLGVPPQRVHVVYEGIDHALFRPVPRRLADPPYLLFVGAEHPRKNLAALLRALAELKRDPLLGDLRLVKVGAAGTAEAPFRAATRMLMRELGLRLGPDVVLVDEHVPDEDLPAYYSGAACFVLPSRYEGFGFPPLEAMACGCPAVVSTAGSLPEVTGGAALTAAPSDVPALASAIRRVLLEPGVASDLRARGLAQAARFSWDRAARATQQVYDAVWRASGGVRGVEAPGRRTGGVR